MRAVAIAAVAFGVLTFWIGKTLYEVREYSVRLRRTAKEQLGRTEAEARVALGRPFAVVEAGPQPATDLDAPWREMNFRPVPRRTVQKRVLLYKDGWMAAYVFIGRDGRVEHVAIAGT